MSKCTHDCCCDVWCPDCKSYVDYRALQEEIETLERMVCVLQEELQRLRASAPIAQRPFG